MTGWWEADLLPTEAPKLSLSERLGLCVKPSALEAERGPMTTATRMIAANLATTLAFQGLTLFLLISGVVLDSFLAVALPLAVVVWGGTFTLMGLPSGPEGGGS